MATPVTLDEIRRWPATVDLPTAARAIGISRSYAYELANSNEFPVRVLKVGTRYRVPTHALLELLAGDMATARAS